MVYLREDDDHPAAVRLVALGPDATAVQVDDPAGDGQAEAGPSLVGGAGGVGTVEAFEDALGLALGDAGTLVGDLDDDLGGPAGAAGPLRGAAAGPGAHLDGAARG